MSGVGGVGGTGGVEPPPGGAGAPDPHQAFDRSANMVSHYLHEQGWAYAYPYPTMAQSTLKPEQVNAIQGKITAAQQMYATDPEGAVAALNEAIDELNGATAGNETALQFQHYSLDPTANMVADLKNLEAIYWAGQYSRPNGPMTNPLLPSWEAQTGTTDLGNMASDLQSGAITLEGARTSYAEYIERYNSHVEPNYQLPPPLQN